MSASEGFPLPTEQVRTHGYRILNAIYDTSKETDCSIVCEATIFAAAMMLLACAKHDCLSEILQRASGVLAEMSEYPDQLLVLKGHISIGGSGRLN